MVWKQLTSPWNQPARAPGSDLFLVLRLCLFSSAVSTPRLRLAAVWPVTPGSLTSIPVKVGAATVDVGVEVVVAVSVSVSVSVVTTVLVDVTVVVDVAVFVVALAVIVVVVDVMLVIVTMAGVVTEVIVVVIVLVVVHELVNQSVEVVGEGLASVLKVV